MPNPMQTANAENKIKKGAQLDDELNDILNSEPASVTPPEASAPNTGAQQTEEFSKSAEGSKKSPSGSFTHLTQVGIGKFRQLTQDKASATDELTRRIYDEIASQVRIVGYCSGYNEKLDFKKTTTRPTDNTSGDAMVAFGLNMYRPRKPDRVIVRYPIDLVTQIQRSASSGLTSSDIKDASALATGEDGFNVKILKFSKKEHELYDWMQKFVGRMFIKEAEEIFDPFYKFSAKGDVKALTSYTGLPEYAATGGSPGLLIKIGVSATKKAKTDKGDAFTIDMTAPDARELTVSYTNTGRSTWTTPSNTIYDKIFATIEGTAYPDQANEMTLAYFKRFYDDNFALVQREQDKAKNITMVPSGDIATKITGTSSETFVSHVFTDASFWENASVEHWYDVEKDGSGYHKRVIRGKDLRLVKRVAKQSKTSGKTTYSNAVIKLTETDGDYSWDKAVTPKIQAALHGAKLTFEMYMEAAAKSAKSGDTKPKSRTFVAVEVPGMTYAELEQMMNAAFSANDTFL